jgi:hypothetical protein
MSVISPKPIVCSRVRNAAGSTGLYVSPSWNRCSRSLARLSEPISVPPGRSAQRPGEDGVLQGAGGDVVQHGEHADRVEGLVRVGERGGVAGHRLHVRPGEPRAERDGSLRLEFDSDEAADSVPQPLGRRAGPRADLQQVVAQVNALRDDRQDLLVQERGPFGRAEQFSVRLVHGTVRYGPRQRWS